MKWAVCHVIPHSGKASDVSNRPNRENDVAPVAYTLRSPSALEVLFFRSFGLHSLHLLLCVCMTRPENVRPS